MLTMYDYLWRWDTDWFWCSGAFGVQNPRIRRLWPRRWRRSDVYHRLIGLENRFGVVARLDRARGRPARERVIQDVEVPVERLPEFLRWFDEHVGMRPVWLCPLRADRASWPSYPLEPGPTYVNVGFWGTVPIGPDAADGAGNRAVEAKVTRARRPQVALLRRLLRPGDVRPALRRRQPAPGQAAATTRTDRLTSLYEKAVNVDDEMTTVPTPDHHRRGVSPAAAGRRPVPLHGVRRQRGRPGGLAVSTCTCATERGLSYLLTAPG